MVVGWTCSRWPILVAALEWRLGEGRKEWAVRSSVPFPQVRVASGWVACPQRSFVVSAVVWQFPEPGPRVPAGAEAAGDKGLGEPGL